MFSNGRIKVAYLLTGCVLLGAAARAQVCEPASNAFGCVPWECSSTGDDHCFVIAAHRDPAAGTLVAAKCECLPLDACRIELLGDGAPAAVGACPAGAWAAALNLYVPRGPEVTAVSDGGMWDEVHRKVKWGPFFEDLSRTVTFQARQSMSGATPKLERIPTEVTRGRFYGTVSFDGINQPITVE